ncbi:MAG: DUF4349 domain-containing protein [Defluviitaleaceae bacterium]|nr:DUF4349 domain-containing protein [Defluviitaleaceae bacterium]MCL2262000.1 DUF4349 domain-containing protein [Defluviitaleaceae bacterium]
MRAIIYFMMLAIFFAFPIIVHGNHLSRSHTIDIRVECIETASEVIAGLNGYTLDSYMHFSERDIRWANFTRRTDDWAFRHVQEVLRELGEVIFESENSRNHSAELLNIETRITVLSLEMERLSLMMAASDSLEVLIAVNDRLSSVSRDRDSLTGRKNLLLSQSESPVIHITLTEFPSDIEERVPLAFGERVSRSFTSSWEHTLRAGGNLLVILARISIPLVLLTGAAGVAWIIILAKRKRDSAAQTKKEAEHEKE